MTEHFLAKTYGWTHDDIMNMTENEITYYLSCLTVEAKQLKKRRMKHV